MNHPYDPLTADEIERAVQAVSTSQPGLLSPRFPLIRLDPPGKETVRRGETSPPAGRSAFLVVYDRGTGSTFEARVDLAANTVTSWKHVPGGQPPIMIEEIMALEEIVKSDPAAVAALARHGVDDLSSLQLHRGVVLERGGAEFQRVAPEDEERRAVRRPAQPERPVDPAPARGDHAGVGVHDADAAGGLHVGEQVVCVRPPRRRNGRDVCRKQPVARAVPCDDAQRASRPVCDPVAVG